MILKRSNIITLSLIVISALFQFRTLTAQFSIGPGGWVTVKSGGSMMIGTSLHIKSVAGSSGYLVDQNVNGNITITGTKTVDRYMSANEWHNAASPVSNSATSVYTGTDLVFYYDETLILNDWNFGWVMMYPSALVPFRGYDVYFYTNPLTVVYSATAAQNVNTGPYTFNVTLTNTTPTEIPSHKGWNLAGNPYPSPVDWLAASGWNKSAINDAKYIWDGANDIYTIYVGGGAPIGINGGTRFIPSNQGFWVQAIQNGSIGINNAVRVGNISGTPDFYKEEPVTYPMVSLVASGDAGSDEMLVRFIPGTTEGFDINWDAMKLFSLNPDMPQLSIRHGNQVFALNTLPEIKEDLAVPLNFQSAKSGFYFINLSARTNLDGFTSLYLKDELEKKIINLARDSVYGFYHDPSYNKGRFTLFFNPSEDVLNDITPATYFSVYSFGNMIMVQKNTVKEVSGEILVFDLLGRPVQQEALGNDKYQAFSTDLASGYYIVSVITSGQVSNSKIFINRKY
jgi:fibronectin-binding autotransporter adhesin